MSKNFVYTLLDLVWAPPPTVNNAVNNAVNNSTVIRLPVSTIVLVIAGILIVGLTVFFLIKNKKKNGDDES